MELLKPNFINSDDAAFVVNSSTLLADYVMNPDPTFQYVSEGFDDDLTTVSMRINFQETLTISRIGLIGINLKEFSLFYNGATASTFALTSTGATTVSSWSSNSETGMFLHCTPVACTSVTIDMKKTMVANSEKAIGYFVLSQERLSFDRIPAAKNYSPIVNTEEVVHKLSDGNTRIQRIADKWSFNIKLEYISETMRNSLKGIYDLHEGHIFVPFGTTTSWDKIMVPVVWPSPFEFYRFSDNAVGAGFEGSITLLETTP